MAQVNIQQLATPDFIKHIPEFDGNPNDLTDFIESVEEAILVINVAPEQVRPFWFRAIKSKIVGNAKSVLRLYGNLLEWNEIRTYLISHFSDRRDERTLFAQLVLLKQNNNNIDTFYQQILDVVSALNNKVAAKINLTQEARQSLIDGNNESGLRSFVSGCRDPLGNILKARQPGTLIEAYETAVDKQRDRPELFNYANQNYSRIFNQRPIYT